MNNVFLDKVSSDLLLRITATEAGPKTMVPAHTVVLRSVNQIFRAMVESACFQEGRTRVVDIKVKGSVEDAIIFLRYLYTKELEYVDLNVYISVLQTAHKYDVGDLVKLCQERIAGVVAPLTVCRTYTALHIVASEDLLAPCRELMIEFAFLVFEKDLHLTLDEKTMSHLLSSDRLNIQSEEQALGALWRWGCARRSLGNRPEKCVEQQISKLLPLIRRPLITKVSESSPWFQLWKDKKFCADTSDWSPLPGTNVIARKPDVTRKLNRHAEVICFSQVATKPDKKLTTNCKGNRLIVFTVNVDILLSGFTIQVTLHERFNPQYNFNIFINHKDLSGLVVFKKIQVNDFTTKKVFTVPTQKGVVPLSQPGYEQFYVYDLVIFFRTPLPLKKTQLNLVTMDMNQPINRPVSLTTYALPSDGFFHTDDELQFHAPYKTAAVTQMHYFV